MKFHIIILSVLVAFSCSSTIEKKQSVEISNPTLEKPVGTLEVVAEMDINPGNVAVSKEGRVFSSIHPLRSKKLQLVELTSKTTYKAFPNMALQSTAETKSDDRLDTPLGIIFDKQDRLWVIDAGLNLGKTRLFAFDIQTKEELFRFDIPSAIAPKSSFAQDLAIDEKNGYVYIADFGNPGIIMVDISTGKFSKFKHAESMKAEDVDMIIDGKVQQFMGSPARIAINPITLSDDRETLFYGAMSGTKWYQVPTAALRNKISNEQIADQITILGDKPISDGIATDAAGNHYITNIQNSSIDVLSGNGELSTLKKDALLDWPDNVRIHQDWLYIAINQLHKSPAFTGDKDLAESPFRILRLKFR